MKKWYPEHYKFKITVMSVCDDSNPQHCRNGHQVGDTYADVIRKSFSTVAQDFSWTRDNAPGHVSFRTDGQLASKQEDGYYPFGLFVGRNLLGFVSLTDMGNGSYELNKLSVLPSWRHIGYGKKLLDFCKEKVRELSGNKITLDIIEENAVLKSWYAANGFVHTGTKKFEQLPFTTGYMEWEVAP